MFHPQGPSLVELARQALSSTERGYDLLAPKFDYTPFRTPTAIFDTIAPLLGGSRSLEAAVDLCCGTGAAMTMLEPLCQRRLCGVDLSHGMLNIARHAITSEHEGLEIEFVQQDVLDLPFHAEFDLAVSFSAFGHILPHQERHFIAQIARALRPGGRFIFVTSAAPPWFSLHSLTARSFNGIMWLRNLLISPPFIMYYLTFTLAAAIKQLRQAGFSVDVNPIHFPPPFSSLRLIVATNP